MASVLAYVMFKVSSGTEREVAQKLADFDEVIHADVVFGEYDVLAKVLTSDLAALEDFISTQVRSVPNVLVTSTIIVSREYKNPNHPQNQH
ncbi:MAG: Lrp/AsnC ligand binding domain-containing protein [Candidatus Bathyarchaeota archaeon]|nr:Lrp/AsnC ligand binding domain-containing protein [Candidatus Bathyarchaeota archaeon]